VPVFSERQFVVIRNRSKFGNSCGLGGFDLLDLLVIHLGRQELNFVCDNLGGITPYAVASLIIPVLNAPADTNFAAFSEIFAAIFGKASPAHNRKEIGLFFVVAARYRHQKFTVCDVGAGNGYLGVLGQIPDQENFVHFFLP